MCGIAGIYVHDPEKLDFSHKQFSKFIDGMLEGIEHRGRDATGLAAISKTGELHIEKADLPASTFELWRSELPRNAQTVMLHTRFATQGSPMNLNNNHPVQYDEVLVTHNGHISNDDELFKNEELNRRAEVDSEIIAALFHRYGIEKAHVPLQKLDGNMAIAVSDLRHPGALLLAKGWQSPLEYYRWNNGIIWASTKDTIREALKVSINFDVKWSDISSLTSGDILLFEDGNFEKLNFKVYDKPYVPKKDYGPSTWHLSSYYSTDTCDTKKKDEDYSYKLLINGEWTYFARCNNCEANFDKKEMKELCNTVFCDACAKEIEEILVEVSEETDEEKDEWDTAHELICEKLSQDYGTTPEFVNWLLFEAEDEDYQSDDYMMANMYSILSDAYDKEHKELTGIQLSWPVAERTAEMLDVKKEAS